MAQLAGTVEYLQNVFRNPIFNIYVYKGFGIK